MEQSTELSVMVGVNGREAVHPAIVRNPADAPIRVAVGDLVGAMRAIGVEGLDGTDFVLRCQRLETILDEEETLVAEGVRDGDVLILVARSDALLDEAALLAARRARHRDAARHLREEPAGSTRPARPDRRRRISALLLTSVVAVAIAAVVVPWLERADTQPLRPRIAGGRWVQLATFRGVHHARAFAADLRAHGIDAQTIASSDVAELYPGWQIVAVGPLASRDQRRRVIHQARRAGFGGGVARTYTPATVRATPATLAGDYRGVLKHTDPRHPWLDHRVRAHVVLQPDGHGAIRYGRRRCLGRLALVKAIHAIVVWRDHTRTHGCPSRGEWVTKLYDGRLVVLWRHPRREDWMEGRLPRTD